jgi:hypothetical protein
MFLQHLLPCLLFAAPAVAGVLKGITLENQTSYPLARARVTLHRLEGDHLTAVTSVIASRSGLFTFTALPEGYYQVSATRNGFAEARHGQRRNNAPGTPLFVGADGEQFVELRLKRFGVITGRTVDENRVGLAGIPVIAYTTPMPMTIAATATSDERGVYRLTHLPPGRYLVRTGAAQLEDGLHLLPTFHPITTTQRRDAQAVSTDLDTETANIDVQPVPGNLFTLSVRFHRTLAGRKRWRRAGRIQSASQPWLQAITRCWPKANPTVSWRRFSRRSCSARVRSYSHFDSCLSCGCRVRKRRASLHSG